MEFQYSYILNPKKKKHYYYEINRTFIQGDVLFSDRVKYKEHDNNIYLRYIMREQGDILYYGGIEGLVKRHPDFNAESVHFRIKRELVVNKIVKTDKPLGEAYLQPKYSSLFPDSYVYNKEFWDGYNILLNSDEEKKLLKDLGNGVPLEQQFIENGRRKK